MADARIRPAARVVENLHSDQVRALGDAILRVSDCASAVRAVAFSSAGELMWHVKLGMSSS